MNDKQSQDPQLVFYYLRLSAVIGLGFLILFIWLINHRHNSTLDAEIKLKEVVFNSKYHAKPITENQLKALNKINIPLNSKITLISQWESWCIPCIKELPTLDHLQSKFDVIDLRVILVNTDKIENLQKAKDLLTKMNLQSIENIFTNDSSALHTFNKSVIPFSFLLNRNQELMHDWSGSYNWGSATVQQQLQGLLNPAE